MRLLSWNGQQQLWTRRSVALDSAKIDLSEYRGRQQAAIERSVGRGWSGLVIVGRSFYDRCGDLAYLTGQFQPFPASTAANGLVGLGHAIALLAPGAEPVLLVDGDYRSDLVAVREVHRCRDLVSGLAKQLQQLGLDSGTLGLCGAELMPWPWVSRLAELMPSLSLEPADELLADLRAAKSPAELALLAEAAKIAHAGLSAALEAALPGAKEHQVCAAGTAAALAAGADFVRYLRVHSGPWSTWSSRWPQATDRRLEDGDVVCLDIIGACRGYQFDVLRTTVVGQRRERETVKLLDAVHAALEAAIGAARPGRTAEEVAAAAHALLAECGPEIKPSPFVGHGIGLETVDLPYLMPGSKQVLRQNMVLCVEPKATLGNRVGCSIEQEVIVTAGGPQVITPTATKLW